MVKFETIHLFVAFVLSMMVGILFFLLIIGYVLSQPIVPLILAPFSDFVFSILGGLMSAVVFLVAAGKRRMNYSYPGVAAGFIVLILNVMFGLTSFTIVDFVVPFIIWVGFALGSNVVVLFATRKSRAHASGKRRRK